MTPAAGDAERRGPPAVVLYRCPTRTNWLCPCGAVARRLGRLGVDHRTVRLPYRRAERPEIEELTSQRLLPVLVDGDEVIHDSKRILQYLDWKHGDRREDDLYNVKHGHPEHGDHAH